MHARLLAATFSAITLITACGQKGPLVLPDDQSTPSAHEHSHQAEPTTGAQQ